MAIAWIREIRNCHPNGKIRIKQMDDGRHPSWNGVTYAKDEWLVVPPSASKSNPSVATPDNMAVPWSYGGKQRLVIQVEVNGVVNSVSAEIRGENAWDFIVLRDNELTQMTQMDAGSLGDAPGVNHSWWGLVLHENGQLEWHLFERQGMTQAGILNVLNGAGSLFIEMLPGVVGAVATVAPLLI